SRYIGSIKLHDDYSTVDLPEGMPDELLAHLKKVRVCAKPMRMSVYNPQVAPVISADNKSPRQPRVKKVLSRDVKNKRSSDSQKPTKKLSSNKKSAGGKLAKTSADGRTFKGKKSSTAKGRPTDGSGPIKKKKTYTKKPKKSKS
ncbi:MAG: DbpA RNA binding domain-containing protein, partial [Porticoccaceae bacterium]